MAKNNMTNNRIPLWVIILLGSSFVFLLTVYPSAIPALWFDEGWTLSVARNWVETGQYARFLIDTPISANGMAWNFPITGPIALSFRVFGVGILQGRLPGILFTLGSIILIYILARHMYSEKIATITILLLIIGFPFPLTYGRQAIGEPAMIFYLLAGFYVFWRYLENQSRLIFILCILLWGASLASKQQTLPFWLLSISVIAMMAGIQKDRFIFRSSIGALLGTLLVWQGMLAIQARLEAGLPLYGAPMQGLIYVTGWVPVQNIRIKALIATGLLAIPLLIGLVSVFFRERLVWIKDFKFTSLHYIRAAYWVLTTSWLLWFIFLAMYWTRYLYPAAFIGSVFTAFFIAWLSNGLKYSEVVNHIIEVPRKLRVTPDIIKSLFIILVISYMGLVFRINLNDMTTDAEAETVAQYLNQSTLPDALIETYDSELLFLVQRRFHYPPDQVQVQLNKRKYLDPTVEIAYDPMAADPDYIVVGTFGNIWKLYDSILSQQDTWQLAFETPTYKVYQRLH